MNWVHVFTGVQFAMEHLSQPSPDQARLITTIMEYCIFQDEISWFQCGGKRFSLKQFQTHRYFMANTALIWSKEAA